MVLKSENNNMRIQQLESDPVLYFLNAKLKLGKVTKVTDIDKGFDRIINQSIAKGKKVKQGTVINITLNAEAEGDGW
jgi:beta-lactam-binding protein with PASTA domain